MTDEQKPDDTQEEQPSTAPEQRDTEEPEATIATAEAPSDDEQATQEDDAEAAAEDDAASKETEATDSEEKEPEKLKQTIEVDDVGPCKKHVKVAVDRGMIDDRIREKFLEVGRDEHVPGFRKGKAPIKVIMRRYRREVSDQVKTEVLMASLEQLTEEVDLAPLSSPDIDPSKIEFPDEGDFIYEFEVEVRPEFDLPEYKGLRLKRPTYDVTDEDVEQEKRRLLFDHGQIVPKDGPAEMGDLVVADLTFKKEDRELGTNKELTLRVEKRLVFKDGVAERFAQQVRGVSAGEQRIVDVKLSSQTAAADLRGENVKLYLDVKDVKQVNLPELTEEFLDETFAIDSEETLTEMLRVAIGRRIEHQQRQHVRGQIIRHIAASSDWELPEDLLVRQARRAISRRIMEMRADGIAEEEIRSQQRLLEQDILKSTALSLKEHFVLQKIAEVEKLEVTDDDIEDEIERLARQSDESARRVRARLQKEDMIEALATEMLERKAVDLIMENATWHEVRMEEAEMPETSVATVDEQAVPGQMRDLEAESAASETPKEETE